MKTIITTVGTSLFDNYMREEIQNDLFAANSETYKSIKDHFKRLRDNTNSASEYSDDINQPDIKHLKETINDFWLHGITKKDKQWVFDDEVLNEYASAEIESILAIQREVREAVEVYLLATDTVLSLLAAELIKNWFQNHNNNQINVRFNHSQDVIRSLQIEDAKLFKDGLVNLNTRFYQIAQNLILAEQFDSVIINVTGGYKGIIPYLTILGQINKSPIKYIFENTGVLITIPQIPIQLNEELFEKYWEDLARLESDILKKHEHYHLISDLEGCFDIDGDDFAFNYLGDALWSRYKSKFFIFYITDDVWEQIQSKQEIKSVIEEKFCIKQMRDNKTGPKLTHKTVYDDGNNSIRIFYFEKNKMLFIYKVFGNGQYDDYERFWSENDFTESALSGFRVHKILIKNY